ncbi:MAG: phosphatase family protein [Thermomicrobiales bacterium]|nr:phosphatase family protein [Thermomicrobiales bacterium]
MRRSECVIVAFLIYAAVSAAILPVRPPVRPLTIALNTGILACYALLVYADRLRRREFLSVVRDWFPLVLVLLAYRQMGWFALPMTEHPLENSWVVWDRLLLRGGARQAIEFLGPVLPAILEISYALVYTLGPFGVAVVYLYRRRERVDAFLFPFLLAVLLCYAQFPYWPSEPPRTIFPGEDFPTYDTVFRRFNWWMLGGYGIHTSVFPSAHVAGAFSAFFGMRIALPEHKWVARFLLVMAILIATATVYGRYHYFADALAGFAMAVLAFLVARRLRPE